MVEIVDDPKNYTVNRWSRGSAYIRWLITHDPATDNARPEALVKVLQRPNKASASYNEVLARFTDGVVRSIVLTPRSQYAGHAGVQTHIPDTAIYNSRVNPWTWGISVCTYGKNIQQTDPELWDALVRVHVHRIRQFKLPDAGVVLSHQYITIPDAQGRKRRSDPRGVDMDALRRAIAAQLARGA